MKRFFTLLGALALLAPPLAVQAAGTAAGTVISNQATATFDVGSSTGLTETSNTDQLTVEELIDVSVVWQDGGNVPVSVSETATVLEFLVTNEGKGSEDYRLTITNQGGDVFDTTNLEIWLDTNGNGTFDPGSDTLVSPGGSGTGSNTADVTFDANGATAALTVFVVGDIPGTPSDADTSRIQLQARSVTAIDNALTTAGDVAAGAGDGGVDAVIGASTGLDSADGIFVIVSVAVALTKTSVVVDPFGGTTIVPGAAITYTIVVDVTGSGSVSSLVIDDDIPTNTTYVANSMTFDTVAQVDAGGADEGELSGGTKGTVIFTIGAVSAVAQHTLTFDVTVD
jgi:uncharacterized repeat protein (TIGR01451 family)